jgi:hypothetical protein
MSLQVAEIKGKLLSPERRRQVLNHMQTTLERHNELLYLNDGS